MQQLGSSQRPFDFWQDHSCNFLEMAFRHDRRERLDNPDGYGKRTGECGDTVEIFLTVREGRIQTAAFDTNGCLHTTACANTVVEMAAGRPPETAWEITPEAVGAFLETLPRDHFHCAELAVGALYLALASLKNAAAPARAGAAPSAIRNAACPG
jgi:nitrogen fixation NifU-like protein